ncbi:Intraflagellar_transport protein IFT56 [Hexamita inflata]|uniref:Intraflagellar transport protein 56 n=1 Tax=Hexamita inflata TaxID=28002 RepID=A0AA86TS43_9EUKA|nr:Intraflagellar transport protein IFT56 [Hexamita inflata]
MSVISAKIQQAFEKQKQLDAENEKNAIPTLMQFIERRDFVGAITLLNFQKKTNTVPTGIHADLWLAYCYFHNGQHDLAYKIYVELNKQEPLPQDHAQLELYQSICLLYMGKVNEARQIATKLQSTPTQNRLLFHCCARQLDEDSLQQYHQKLQNKTPDQMALAAVHYIRTHYNQALECYEEVLAAQPEYYAIYLNMALCYYKLGEYERCEEQLNTYREHAEDSFSALNLMAAVKFKQGKLKDAGALLDQMKNDKIIEDLPLYKHNKCLYQGMNAATHILATLTGQVPEARGNLVRLYIEKKMYKEAYTLLQNFEPAVSSEYCLRAAAFAYYGQHVTDMNALTYARAAYATVGQSDADKDTLLGRRSMAAAFFLDGEFDDASLYYESIEDIAKESEEQFDLNYGLTLAAIGKDDKALELLARQINSAYFTVIHRHWLARLFIRAKKAKMAMELYAKSERNNPRTMQLLRIIAHECFGAGEYQLAADAVKILLKDDAGNNELIQEYKTIYRAAMAGATLKLRGKKVAPPKMAFEDQ